MQTAALLRVAALVFVAVTLVVIGDTAGKLLTQSGTDPIFVAWSRFAIAALLLAPVLGLRRADLAGLRDWRLYLRAATIAVGICCILTGLRTEPIANVFGAFFIGPVVSYGLAVLFLGERPTRLRTALLLLGLAGVMLVVKPGFGATPGMGFALAAGVSYGIYLALTRLVAPGYRPQFLLLSQLLIGTVLLTPLGVNVAWPAPSLPIAALVVLSALGSAAGNFCLVLANQRAEASLIAPLVYSQLLSATVLGVLVFGDWPDPIALFGLTLIAVSGLGTLYTQRGK